MSRCLEKPGKLGVKPLQVIGGHYARKLMTDAGSVNNRGPQKTRENTNLIRRKVHSHASSLSLGMTSCRLLVKLLNIVGAFCATVFAIKLCFRRPSLSRTDVALRHSFGLQIIWFGRSGRLLGQVELPKCVVAQSVQPSRNGGH